MKFAAVVIAIVVVFIGVFGVIAPKDFTVEKSLIINRPYNIVFDSIKILRSHAEWNPNSRKDPYAKFEPIGTDGTEGFILKWKGNQEVGQGEQEIKKIIPNQRIDFEVRYIEPIDATHWSYIITKEMYNNQTEVTWGMKGRTNFPGNIFSYLVDRPKQISYDLDAGLRVMKAILEKPLEMAKAKPIAEAVGQIRKELVEEKSNDKKVNQPTMDPPANP